MHYHISHKIYIRLNKMLTRLVLPLPIQGFQFAEIGIRGGVSYGRRSMNLMTLMMVAVTVLCKQRSTSEKERNNQRYGKQRLHKMKLGFFAE